jgi:hypothetical protein
LVLSFFIIEQIQFHHAINGSKTSLTRVSGPNRCGSLHPAGNTARYLHRLDQIITTVRGMEISWEKIPRGLEVIKPTVNQKGFQRRPWHLFGSNQRPPDQLGAFESRAPFLADGERRD